MRTDLENAVRALIAVLSDDPNDYPDAAAFRAVMDAVARTEEALFPTEEHAFIELEDCTFFKGETT